MQLSFCHMIIMQLVTWLYSDWHERIWKLPCQLAQEIARGTPDPFPRRGVGSGEETISTTALWLGESTLVEQCFDTL